MKMLFCSDGLEQSENAVRFGAPIAAGCEAETTILGIAEKASDEKPLLKALVRAQEILKEHHLNAEVISKGGSPVPEIVERTRKESYDLVVIGAVRHGEHSPLCMSLRAYKIIESVLPPVLVVIGERPALRRILLCSSGAVTADKSIEFTGTVARSVNAVVDLVHVAAEPPVMYADMVEGGADAGRMLSSSSKLGRALSHQKGLLEELGVFGEFRLRCGLVVPELLQELRRTEYDLVVVGSLQAEDMLRQYVMDDVAREIVEGAELPVLVMRTESTGLLQRIGSAVTNLFHHGRESSETAAS